jgi:ABC-2 type transport system ATP-binding protein
MKAVSGRIRLAEGEIFVEGANIRRQPSRLSAISFVPQEIALYGHLTVKENLQVFASAAGGLKASVITEILEKAGLEERADQICGSLSGGYQRRLNICVALLKRPRILLLDEPTVGVDIDAREAIHRLLEDRKRDGAAILVSTHDLDQAESICDRVGFMRHGRIVLEGRPRDLLRQAFGDRIEVTAVLRRPADQAQIPALKALGFEWRTSDAIWVSYQGAEHIDAAELARRLSGSGLQLREIRVREPDLASLFTRVAQEKGPA